MGLIRVLAAFGGEILVAAAFFVFFAAAAPAGVISTDFHSISPFFCIDYLPKQW